MKKLKFLSLTFLNMKTPKQLQVLIKSHLRKLFFLSFPILISITVSCKEGDYNNEIETIEYSLDTISINSKGRLLDLNGWMLTSDLNDEESSFYLFNRSDFSIDEINLESKEFVKSFPLEPEGSNGVGDYIFGLQILDDSIFFTKSFILSTLIRKNGLVIKRIGWDFAKDSNGKKLEQFPRKLEVVSNAMELIVYGISYDFENLKVFLDVFSDKDSTVKRFDVDPEN